MRKILIIISFLSLSLNVIAQVEISPEWNNLILQWSERNNINDEDLYEHLTQLHENPININDTSKLDEIFLLDIIQQKAIKSYILQYGPLYSIEELHMINGFDTITIRLLKLIATATPIKNNKPINIHNVFNYGKHSLIVGTSENIERSRGYKDTIYDGNPLRIYYKYNFKYQDRVSIMFSGEKDPGEALFRSTQPHGFDFYGYHILLNDFGKFKRTIIGQYYLQFGQGLTLWTGFNPYNTTNIYRQSQGIRPAGVFTEYNYLNGAASTIEITKNINMTLFYSNVNRSATRSDSCDEWIQSIYNSGYHRTSTELAKKKLINEQLWGCIIQYNRKNLHLGVTAQQMHLSKEIHPKQTSYNLYNFKGKNNFNIGIDASYLWKHLLTFGEFAISKNLGLAGLLGIQIPINSNTRFCAYYRNFSPSYQNFYANTLRQNSKSQNEEGIYLSLITILPFSFNIQLSADFFRFPWLKYQVNSPSNGAEYQLQISKNITKNIDFNITYQHKEYGHNLKKEDIPTYLVTQIYKNNLRFNLRYNIGNWTFISHFSNAWYQSEYENSKWGFYVGQDVVYHPIKTDLSISSRLAFFNAPNYNVRIFSVENNLQYEYNTNTFTNQGLRFYLVLHYNINSQLSLNAKYNITYYTNQDTIGSGYDLISSNHRQNIKLQVRWKF